MRYTNPHLYPWLYKVRPDQYEKYECARAALNQEAGSHGIALYEYDNYTFVNSYLGYIVSVSHYNCFNNVNFKLLNGKQCSQIYS